MIAELGAKLRRLLGGRRVAEGLRATGAELRDSLARARETVLDETDALSRDGEDLASRIRRNAAAGRGVLGGERPL